MSIFRKKNVEAAHGSTPLTLERVPFGSRLARKLSGLLGKKLIDDSFVTELEEMLLESDLGLSVTGDLLSSIRGLKSAEEARLILAEKMKGLFPRFERALSGPPHVMLMVGANGVGKTTTIAKLANVYLRDGKKVLLVAADTFRAAAQEQLSVWGERLSLDVVTGAAGADAASVVFDGIEKAKSKSYDIVIVDTAGRLHTKQNLMEELKKVCRVAGKAAASAPHEKIIVIDGTVGSNGFAQAKEFNDAIGLTGAIIAKLDGTAKGGIIFAIAGELKIPITHIGVGEGMEDLKPFDPVKFVDGIIAG